MDLGNKPSVFVSSIASDSTNHGLKNIWKIIPESLEKQNLNLLHTGNYLHNSYIALHIIYYK